MQRVARKITFVTWKLLFWLVWIELSHSTPVTIYFLLLSKASQGLLFGSECPDFLLSLHFSMTLILNRETLGLFFVPGYQTIVKWFTSSYTATDRLHDCKLYCKEYMNGTSKYKYYFEIANDNDNSLIDYEIG